jgi:CTP synthase
MPDAYLSLMEALKHAGIANRARVDIDWVSAEEVAEEDDGRSSTRSTASSSRAASACAASRARCARRATRARRRPLPRHLPRLQVAVIEFARHVAGLDGANSTEFD